MKKIVQAICFVALQTILGGCFSSHQSSVPASPYEDEPYFQSYKNSTRNIRVYDDFETKLTATVTLLNPEFLKSFQKRYENIFDEPASYLTEAGNGVGVFITAFAPGLDDIDLSDTQLWTIKLDSNGKKVGPSLVRKLNRKKRWSPFFGDVNPWSSEFLVVFDASDFKNLSLVLSSSNVRGRASW